MIYFILGVVLTLIVVLAFLNRDALAVRFYNDLAARAAKRANAAMAKGDAHEKAHQLEKQRGYEAKAAAAAARMEAKTKPTVSGSPS